MKNIAFVLLLFCCISCTKNVYKNYDDFLVELKRENMNKVPINLSYVGTVQNQDRFLLNNKKVIIENGTSTSKVAPFVHESEKYDFISWDTERRLRLKAALTYKDGNADLTYASLDNENIFVIDRDMPRQSHDADSDLNSPILPGAHSSLAD